MVKVLDGLFSKIRDFRVKGMILYPIREILFCTLVGTLAGAEDFEEINLFCNEKIDLLKTFLKFEHGVASVATFYRVFRAIDDKEFEQHFIGWASSLVPKLQGVIALDGKAIKGSKGDDIKSTGKDFVHLVSAYAHESGLVLGQEKVSEKSNEITAIPKLLDKLDIENCIITIDAMGTQKEITQKIVSKKADYLLALKGNHSTLKDDVETFFKDKIYSQQFDKYEETDAGHGRVEIRESVVTSDIDWLKKLHPDWADLQTIVQINSTRFNKKTKKESYETRYYISSLDSSAKEILSISRNHWSIENSLHWVLDVIWQEDSCRVRKDNAATNLATIRKISFNLIKLDSSKMSLKKKRKKAGWNNEFLKKLIY